MNINIDIFTKFEDLRVLCTKPSRRVGGGRVPFKGNAPAELFQQVGLEVEELARWIGNGSSEREPTELAKFSAAVDVVTGTVQTTFKEVIRAADFVERIVLEVEAAKLDEGRARKGRSVDELSDHALRQEVLSRRFGLYKVICRISEEVKREVKANRAYTAPELIAELDRLHKVRRDREAFERQQGEFSRFKREQAAGKFSGNFEAFKAKESRERAAKRRANRPAQPPSAVVTTVEATGDGETKVVETKVSRPRVEMRRPAAQAQPN